MAGTRRRGPRWPGERRRPGGGGAGPAGVAGTPCPAPRGLQRGAAGRLRALRAGSGRGAGGGRYARGARPGPRGRGVCRASSSHAPRAAGSSARSPGGARTSRAGAEVARHPRAERVCPRSPLPARPQAPGRDAPAGSGGRLRQLSFGGDLLATERGRNEQGSTEDTPKSVLINRTDRENPAALMQRRGVNPGVQYIPAYTLSLLPVFFALLVCAPFDASDLLWKVKSKYDPSLTVLLCTFLCKEGRFIA